MMNSGPMANRIFSNIVDMTMAMPPTTTTRVSPDGDQNGADVPGVGAGQFGPAGLAGVLHALGDEVHALAQRGIERPIDRAGASAAYCGRKGGFQALSVSTTSAR